MSEQPSGKHLKPSAGKGDRPAERAARSAPPARRAAPAYTPEPDDGGADWPPRSDMYEEPERRRKRPFYDILVRCLVLALLFASMAVFVFVLMRTQMLTTEYLLIIGGLLLVIFIIMAIFMLAFGKRHLPWAAIVVSLLLTAVLAVGSYMGNQGTETLRAITTQTYNTSHIGIYVRQEDPAQALADTREYTFGILESMGRDGVDKAIADINEQMNASIQTAAYANPTMLVEGLVNGEVNAAIMDTSYLDGLNEVEQYQETVAKLREITDMHVQVAVEPSPTPEPSDEQAAEQEEKEDNTFVVLISGIDSRSGLVRSSLCDVNILVTVNTDTHQVLMVSTPRDYCVTFANNGVSDKLTHAGWYGEDVLVQTISNLYDGLDIDYYFRINFEGFVSIIDALGGVTVDSTYEFTTYNEGIHFNAGENQLNGEQALAFARERRSFTDGDEQRGRNQMALIRGIAKKVMSTELLTRYSSVLDAVQGCFETTVPYDLIASLVRRQLDEGGDWDIVSYSVSGEGVMQESPTLGRTVYMMIPDQATIDTAEDYMTQVRDGVILNAPGDTVGT